MEWVSCRVSGELWSVAAPRRGGVLLGSLGCNIMVVVWRVRRYFVLSFFFSFFFHLLMDREWILDGSVHQSVVEELRRRVYSEGKCWILVPTNVGQVFVELIGFFDTAEWRGLCLRLGEYGRTVVVGWVSLAGAENDCGRWVVWWRDEVSGSWRELSKHDNMERAFFVAGCKLAGRRYLW